jgi:hypothetical protein
MQARGALTWLMRSSDKPLGIIVKLESAKRPFDSSSIVVSSMAGRRGAYVEWAQDAVNVVNARFVACGASRKARRDRAP